MVLFLYVSGVNKNTVPDQFPQPRIDELTDMIGRNKPRIFTADEELPLSKDGRGL